MAFGEPQLAQLLGLTTFVFLSGLWLLPGGVLALRRRAQGELQVDVRPGYSPETLYRLLQLYGRDGVRSFRRLLMADMVFPAIYGGLLYLLGDMAAPAHPSAAGILRVAAFAAPGFDYLENFFLLFVLHQLPRRRPFAARAAGISTALKTVCIAGSLAALATVALTSFSG
jgi:hypothetical protein